MATRLFTREEVAALNQRENGAIIIDNVVYQISDFLLDHPGGPEVLVDNAGKDASQCFADVGHSDDAIEWRKQLKIGEVVKAEHREPAKQTPSPYLGKGSEEPATVAGMVGAAWPPVLLALVAYFLYTYLFQ